MMMMTTTTTIANTNRSNSTQRRQQQQKATSWSPVTHRIRHMTSIRRWKQIRRIRIRERKNAIRQAIYHDLIMMRRQQQQKHQHPKHDQHHHVRHQKHHIHAHDQNNQTATIEQRDIINIHRHTTKKNASNTIDNEDDNNQLSRHSPDRLRYVEDDENDDDYVVAGDEDDHASLGYALVTGASRGIGRAIAVELARYDIPLILVARDQDKLMELSYDVETCYGVKCYVIPADLSQHGIAERIYETTKAAKVKVDFLINNAGISTYNPCSFHIPIQRIYKMIQINTVAVTALTHLYGYDMKQRRRGRILIVSSILGAVSGITSVAVYAATKTFENSLSHSLSKDLEPYGVGVTCYQPGAVRETNLKSKSHSEHALCWKVTILFLYTRTNCT
jgi:uncharacterized protein